MTKYTKMEIAQLKERFAEHWPFKVWANQDVATVSIPGGHYYIKKREAGYDWRWMDANPFNDCGPLVLTHAATLAEI